MIVSVPKMVRRLYFMIMFIALSYLLYYAMAWLGEWISPVDHYEIPEGTAVRAFQDADRGEDRLSAGQRLRFFYWYGE